MKHLGQSYKKTDSTTILSGKAAYTEDFIPSNALCIKILRSPHAFAKIVDIKYLVWKQYIPIKTCHKLDLP